jgi:hypothetical protein
MKIQKLKLLVVLGLVILVGAGCNSGGTKNELDILPPGNHRAEILEVQQASNYTYLLVDEDGEEYWIAVNKQEFNEGDVIYHLSGMEMKDFESKDLNRTFKSIFFVQDISNAPIHEIQEMVGGQTEPMKPRLAKEEVSVEIPAGGISIGDLYANLEGYKDQTVIVRGEVVKINLAIMERNWIHIQDGTGDAAHFDLTVTTQHAPAKGDVVTYKGKVSINKDFGMGYFYELILEDAVVVE